MAADQHRNNFDALRLAAALAVLVSHAYPLSDRPEPTALGGITLGTTAVYVFFAISGYLVTISWRLDPHPVRFLCKRMLRIGPGYIGALGVVGLCLSAARMHDFAGNPGATVNGSLWTIPYEVQCYLLLLGVSMLTRHAGLVLIAVIVATAGYGYLMSFLAYFAAGSLIAEYPLLRRKMVLAGSIAAGVALMVIDWNVLGPVLLIAPAAIWMGTSSWPGVSAIGRGGDISYGVYLYAFPITQALVMLLGPDAPVLLIIALAILFSVGAGIASWRLIERPALALKPSPSVRIASEVVSQAIDHSSGKGPASSA